MDDKEGVSGGRSQEVPHECMGAKCANVGKQGSFPRFELVEMGEYGRRCVRGVVAEYVAEEADGRHSASSATARGCWSCWDYAFQ
jgi:hypothetical protein